MGVEVLTAVHLVNQFYKTLLLLLLLLWRTTGLEPANDGVTVHCLTTWLRTPSKEVKIFLSY